MSSFALQVKQEILSAEYSYQDALEIVSGIISTDLPHDKNLAQNYVIKINNTELANLIRDMLNQMQIKYSSDKTNHNYISLPFFPYINDVKNIKTLSWYFAGTFVGGGSISKLKASSYHLELQFVSRFRAIELQNILNKLNFNFHLIQRRKLWVLYLKKSDQISDFLKTIQTVKALMNFEDERINRDYKNHLNRYSNLDTYNLQKMAKSHLQFERTFRKIESKKLLHLFSKKELNFYRLKLKNRYTTLNELAVLYFSNYHVKISKSGLNHYLIKLKRISIENE